MPNWSQISGAVDRVILITLGWFVGKGYISSGDATIITGGLVAILGVFYSMFVNRNANLAKQAASIPGTIVVTTPEVAAATPNNQNILPNTQTQVVPK